MPIVRAMLCPGCGRLALRWADLANTHCHPCQAAASAASGPETSRRPTYR